MAKRKLQRFGEIETFPNVFQHAQRALHVPDHPLKGNWNNHFKNNNPIIVELGCGKGEYTVGLAEAHPNKNYIGADLKGNRIWRGAKTALETGLTNVAFVRTRIENIETVFGKDEVDEIWVTFPDPQPQESREKKRLTAPPFLSRYKNILKPNGVINLKTDNAPLYHYTLEVIKEHNYELLDATDNLYEGDHEVRVKNAKQLTTIQTYYEKKFSDKGFKICYLKFRMR